MDAPDEIVELVKQKIDVRDKQDGTIKKIDSVKYEVRNIVVFN